MLTKALAYLCAALAVAALAFAGLWRYQTWQTKAWKAETDKRELVIGGLRADLAACSSSIQDQNRAIDALRAAGARLQGQVDAATVRQSEIREDYERRIRQILLETPPKEPKEALEWLRRRIDEER